MPVAELLVVTVVSLFELGGVEDVDLVVEVVFENSELKAKITKLAEEQIGESAVFGSNTSSIPITDLAKASSLPDFILIDNLGP